MAGTPQGGSCAPLFALMAVQGMDEAITQRSREARGIASADDGLVRHPERAALEPCQQLLTAWLAQSGRTRNVSKTPISHP
jgi:RNA-directed DNA polymerase